MNQPTVREPAFINHDAVPTAIVRGVDVPHNEMIRFLDAAFTGLRAASDAAIIAVKGSGFSVYHSELEGEVRLDAGYPVIAPLEHPIEFGDVVIEPGELAAGEIARAVHTGPYNELRAEWDAFLAGLRERGREPQMPYVEVYRNVPAPEVDPWTLRTDLFAYV